jgi:hypothetical protein
LRNEMWPVGAARTHSSRRNIPSSPGARFPNAGRRAQLGTERAFQRRPAISYTETARQLADCIAPPKCAASDLDTP